MSARILVYDADVDSRNLITARLKREGHEILATHCIQVAKHIAQNAQPDIIVFDPHQNAGEGLEFMKWLKSRDSNQNIGTILILSKTREADIFGSWLLGPDAVLCKPVNPLELLNFVDSLLQSQRLARKS